MRERVRGKVLTLYAHGVRRQWDADGGGPPSATRDAPVATSLATAAAMLHSTLPVHDADSFQLLGWAYTRATNAGVTATEAAATDPVSAASALYVEEEALLGYSQVRGTRGRQAVARNGVGRRWQGPGGSERRVEHTGRMS